MTHLVGGRTVYSLWMLPPPDIADKLRNIISDLSQTFDTIAFEPHITLFPMLYDPTPMIVHRVKELCSKLKPFKIRLTKMECGQSFYQCFYILVELTPELITANSMCRKTFQRFDDPPFKPHLSLLYCDPSQISMDMIEEKIDLNVEEIGEFMVDSVELWLTPVQKDKIAEWSDYQRFHLGVSMNTTTRSNAKIDECVEELFPKDWGRRSGIRTNESETVISNVMIKSRLANDEPHLIEMIDELIDWIQQNVV